MKFDEIMGDAYRPEVGAGLVPATFIVARRAQGGHKGHPYSARLPIPQ